MRWNLLAGAGVVVLALTACATPEQAPGPPSSPAPEPSPTEAPPLVVDVVHGDFPDALEEGVVDVADLSVDVGYGVLQADGTVVHQNGVAPGEVNRFGVINPSDGSEEWLTEALVDGPDVRVSLGQREGEWVVWSRFFEEHTELTGEVPFIYARNLATGETYELADRGTDEDGAIVTPSGTSTAVAILGDRAYWVDHHGDVGDSALLSRALDASGPVEVVHAGAVDLRPDLCAEAAGAPALTFTALDDGATVIFRVGPDHVVEGVLELNPAGSHRYEDGVVCGDAFLGLLRAGEGEEDPEHVEAELVERGGTVTTFRTSDYGDVADLSLSDDWVALRLENGSEESDGAQVVHHRPTRQTFRLPHFSNSSGDVVRQRAGYLTFGYDPTPDDAGADRVVVLGRLQDPTG